MVSASMVNGIHEAVATRRNGNPRRRRAFKEGPGKQEKCMGRGPSGGIPATGPYHTASLNGGASLCSVSGGWKENAKMKNPIYFSHRRTAGNMNGYMMTMMMMVTNMMR